jgi:ubiquinone biosynthesis protein UbiJ
VTTSGKVLLTDGNDKATVVLLEVARGDADHADATIDTDPDTLNAVLWRGRPLADAQRSGTMTIDGDKAAVERFVELFPMPSRHDHDH